MSLKSYEETRSKTKRKRKALEELGVIDLSIPKDVDEKEEIYYAIKEKYEK